ncbi:hypothetical protein JIR001_19140 [Polycladomyces abyssicola]|uniref:Uncharacterized protein n=1 Tax=Polycladomyces abyssicola TaxID=1125966 RepID=A0A8D5UGQ3_9BACL|nr:hypothetical protein [Polycladomyces abyssicola]BCU82131.1 hypothetical protein JIR001_19140 [Polycladomyces abyssicola]
MKDTLGLNQFYNLDYYDHYYDPYDVHSYNLDPNSFDYYDPGINQWRRCRRVSVCRWVQDRWGNWTSLSGFGIVGPDADGGIGVEEAEENPKDMNGYLSLA